MTCVTSCMILILMRNPPCSTDSPAVPVCSAALAGKGQRRTEEQPREVYLILNCVDNKSKAFHAWSESVLAHNVSRTDRSFGNIHAEWGENNGAQP